MGPTSDAVPHQTPQPYRLFAVLLAISVAVSLATTWLFQHGNAGRSLFALSNLVGPTTESLLQGKGLTACTEAMGTPLNPICFHAARMPLPSLVVALGVKLLGNHYLRVAFFKTILLLLPLELALYIVWRLLPRSPGRRRAIALLLLAPFTMTTFLANVVNLQVEEAYAYSLLAMAVAVLFFATTTPHTSRAGIPRALLFTVAIDGAYLSKSALAPAIAVLLLGYLLLERRTALRLLVLALAVAAPLGWAIHQHRASGRYSIGTSLDGINLHKGNNADFLSRYPPPPGTSLDQFDQQLNQGLYFPDEWSFSDYHRTAALTYLRQHPRQTLQADARKLNILFFSIQKIGSTRDRAAMHLLESAGLLLFRLILWTSVLSAAYAAFRPTPQSDPALRTIAAIFLALIAACTVPYLLGFAYTRHISILIYPAALFCCRMLAADAQSHAPR